MTVQQICDELQKRPDSQRRGILAGLGERFLGLFGRGRAASRRRELEREVERLGISQRRQLERCLTGRAAPTAAPAPPRREIKKPTADRFKGAAKLRRVLSSNVYAIGYQEDTQTLMVRFKADRIAKKGGGSYKITGKVDLPGSLYHYFGVPPEVWADFLGAGSPGVWLWDNVRIKGSVSGHQYDYRLAAGTISPGTKLVNVPRKATEVGMKPRQIRHTGRMVKSLLPGTGRFG